MPVHSAVIDNDALVNLFNLNKEHPKIFNLLKSLFRNIHIPMAIKSEFLNHHRDLLYRAQFIDQLRLDSGAIRICTQYDLFTAQMWSANKGIDSGESEVIAQKQKVSAAMIISDDTAFKDELKRLNVPGIFISSLHVIAYIELNNLYPDCKVLKNSLQTIRPYSKEQLKSACKEMADIIGMTLPEHRLKKMVYYENS